MRKRLSHDSLWIWFLFQLMCFHFSTKTLLKWKFLPHHKSSNFLYINFLYINSYKVNTLKFCNFQNVTPVLRKYSSCSTIFIDDSTVSQPNLKNTIKAVAFAIYFHIRNRESNRTLEIFDEKLHPLSVSHQNINFKMIQNIPKSIT